MPLSFNDAFAHTVHFTDHVVLHLPFVDGCRIVSNAACGKMGHQLFVLELIERKAVTRLAVILKALNIGNDSRIDLQLNIAGCGGLAGLIVFVLKIKPRNAAFRNDIRTETERQ